MILIVMVMFGSGVLVSVSMGVIVSVFVISLFNVVVYCVGDGSVKLMSVVMFVFVDIINFNDGLLVWMLSLLISISGSNRLFLVSGIVSSEGMLMCLVDVYYLVLIGYVVSVGLVNVKVSDSVIIFCVIGCLDSVGIVDIIMIFFDVYSGDNIWSVVSIDGCSFYVIGGNSGVWFYVLGVSSGFSISSVVFNLC